MIQTAHLLLLVVLSASPANPQSYDVRRAYWGMDPEGVIRSEGRQPTVKNRDFSQLDYIFKVRTNDLRVYHTEEARYFFKRGKLVRVTSVYYWRTMKPFVVEDPIGKYEKIRQEYIQSYGPPIFVEEGESKNPGRTTEWIIEDRTHLRISLESRNPKISYDFVLLHTELEYWKEKNPERMKEMESPFQWLRSLFQD